MKHLLDGSRLNSLLSLSSVYVAVYILVSEMSLSLYRMVYSVVSTGVFSMISRGTDRGRLMKDASLLMSKMKSNTHKKCRGVFPFKTSYKVCN